MCDNVYPELSEYLDYLNARIRENSMELEYLHSFLSMMHLWDEFYYFQKHAHLEQDPDDPFPRYVL